MNRCIQKIAFEVIVSQSDTFFLLLVPFFMQNPMFMNFRYNTADRVRVLGWCLSRIAFALGQFDSLGIFQLTFDSRNLLP
jgi:hypothetical protein